MLQKLTSRVLTTCAPLSLAFLTGCDIEFPEQEVRLMHDAEADTLERGLRELESELRISQISGRAETMLNTHRC